MDTQVTGNIFTRWMHGRGGMAPGTVISGHTHKFDHMTVLFSGRWRIRKWYQRVAEDGTPVEDEWVQLIDMVREGPFELLIEAQAQHEFTFLGHFVPEWMEEYVNKLSTEDAVAFRRRYELTQSKAVCVYSHRNPQGDVVEQYTGWEAAYG